MLGRLASRRPRRSRRVLLGRRVSLPRLRRPQPSRVPHASPSLSPNPLPLVFPPLHQPPASPPHSRAPKPPLPAYHLQRPPAFPQRLLTLSLLPRPPDFRLIIRPLLSTLLPLDFLPRLSPLLHVRPFRSRKLRRTRWASLLQNLGCCLRRNTELAKEGGGDGRRGTRWTCGMYPVLNFRTAFAARDLR